MTIKTMTRTIRIKDHNAIPMDICIDFSDSIDPVMFFEIEQENGSIVVSIDGIEALWSSAKKLQEEFNK